MSRAARLPLLPTVTFLVPVPPGTSPDLALAALDGLDYPRDRVEILVIEGKNPSRQRNAGAAAARGELLYYIDNDSVLDPLVIRRALECLVDHPLSGDIAGVGGPVSTAPSDTPFQKAAGAALGSLFGLGPFRSRYGSRGSPRPTTEAELISANLIVRRAAVAAGHGFDERLYPNEENELLNRLSTGGALLFHHPGMICHRSQRRDLWAVIHQHVRYGRGRARHIAIDRRGFRPILLLPVGLLLSLGAAVVAPSWVTALPPIAYAVLAVAAAGERAATMERPALAFVHLAAIFPAMHLGYAAGMIWETGARLAGNRLSARPRDDGAGDVTVRVVRPLGA